MAMQGETIKIFGEGNQIRDYLYVDDITDAFLKVGASEKTNGEIFNIGTDETVRFREMVDLILKTIKTGKKTHVPWPDNYERNETGDYVADTRKINKILQWKPTISLEEGIKRTVEYYQKNQKHYW